MVLGLKAGLPSAPWSPGGNTRGMGTVVFGLKVGLPSATWSPGGNTRGMGTVVFGLKARASPAQGIALG